MDCVALKVPSVFFVRSWRFVSSFLPSFLPSFPLVIYDVISINLIADCFEARHRYRSVIVILFVNLEWNEINFTVTNRDETSDK